MTPSLVKSIFPKLSYIFGGAKPNENAIKKIILMVLRLCLYYNYSVSYDSFNVLSNSLRNTQIEYSQKNDEKFIDALNNQHSYQKKASFQPNKTYNCLPENNVRNKEPLFNNTHEYNNNVKTPESEEICSERSDSTEKYYERDLKENSYNPMLKKVHLNDQKMMLDTIQNKNNSFYQKNGNKNQNSNCNGKTHKILTINTNINNEVPVTTSNDDFINKRNLTVSPRKATTSKSVASKSTKPKKTLNSLTKTSNLKGILKIETDQKNNTLKVNKSLKNGTNTSRTDKNNQSVYTSKKLCINEPLNKSNIKEKRNSVKKPNTSSKNPIKSARKSISKSTKLSFNDENSHKDATKIKSLANFDNLKLINESQSTKADTISYSQQKISNVLDIHDYELDKIKLYTEKDLIKLIDILGSNIQDYYKKKLIKDINYLLCKSIPFMIRMLLKFFDSDLYNKVFQMLLDIPDYFDYCSESIKLLVKELLDMFFRIPKELLLQEDVVDIFIKVPYKVELFSVQIEKIRIAEVPTLPLLIKVLQSMISADDQDVSQIRKSLMPCINTQITTLVTHINNSMAEVRKSVVFCLVELKFLLNNNEFQEVIKNFEPSHQKLVSVYIMRRNSNANNFE